MARLSSPESVLKKLDNVYDKVDELYETVDLIHKIRDKFNNSYKELEQDESRLKKTIAEFNELETVYEDTLKRLENIGKHAQKDVENIVFDFNLKKAKINEALLSVRAGKEETEAELNRLSEFINNSEHNFHDLEDGLETFKKSINTELAQNIEELFRQQNSFKETANHEISLKLSEKARLVQIAAKREIQNIISELYIQKVRIDEALEPLCAERKNMEGIHNALDQGLSRINENIASETKYLTTEIETFRNDSQEKITSSLEHGKNLIEQKLEHLSVFADASEKEINDLIYELKVFQEHTDKNLNLKIEEISGRQTAFQESATKEIASSMKTFRNDSQEKITSSLEHGKNLIEQKLDHLSVFADDSEKKINNLIHKLRLFQERTDKDLNLKVEEMSGRQTAFQESATNEIGSSMETFRNDSQEKITSSLEHGKNLIEQKLEHLSAFADASEKEINNLANNLGTFQKRINKNFKQKIEEISGRQAAFQESANSEMDSRFSEKTGQLQADIEKELENIVSEFERQKAGISEALKTVRYENKEIEDMRQVLEYEMTQAKQNITSNASQYSEQLRKVFASFQKKLGQTSDETKNFIDEKVNHFSAFTENSKKEINNLTVSLETLKKQVDDTVNYKLEVLLKQQEINNQALTNKILARISDEAEKIRKTAQEKITAKMDEFLREKGDVMNGLNQRITGFEEQVSVVQHEHKNAWEGQKQTDIKLTNFIKKLARQQNEYQKTFPGFEKRMQKIEQMLEKIIKEQAAIKN
ncbi:MAG: hypothetical protein GY749_18465 [Desulfobacteraceae bacterium]|nr:hypothetical protein [Desulfobacteraceae bacterium]